MAGFATCTAIVVLFLPADTDVQAEPT
jgi:hypothetical protein